MSAISESRFASNGVAICQDNKWRDPITAFFPFKFEVNRPSRVIRAPVESGQAAADNKVLDPIVIKVTGKYMRYAEGYDSSGYDEHGRYRASHIIPKLADSKDILRSVISPDGFYNNLSVTDVTNISETSEVDLITCTITLEEVLLVNEENSKTPMSEDNFILTRGGYINI